MAISMIACAAATASSPSGSATFSLMPRRAPSASSFISPPRKLSGSSRPSTTLASVMVGSVPPPR
jgi:hypothetical protein